MTTRSVTLAALLTALGRPSWWILALAGFLVRGGILLFLLAVVTLPSPLALSNVLRPVITPLYFGRLEPMTAALIAAAVTAAVAGLLGGGWIAAATEVVLVRDAQAAAAEEHLPARPRRATGSLVITRATAAHLVALVPAGLALALGSVRIFDVAYAELTSPSDAGPIVPRVIAGAALPIAIVAVFWIVGEIVGGLAVRRLVLGGESVLGSVGRAAIDLVQRPAGSLIAPLVTVVVLALDLAAVLALVSIVWMEVRTRLVRPLEDPVATALALGTLGAAWTLALLVTGLIAAWRSTAMTVETERAAVAETGAGLDDDGTIGASAGRRPGDWSTGDPGGSL